MEERMPGGRPRYAGGEVLSLPESLRNAIAYSQETGHPLPKWVRDALVRLRQEEHRREEE